MTPRKSGVIAAVLLGLLLIGYQPAVESLQEIFEWACGGDVCLGSASGARDVYLVTGGTQRVKVARDGTTTFSTFPLFTMGTGTQTATGCGTLTTNTTSASNTASTSEQDLWTYTLPANSLATNGRAVRITAIFTYAANANSKFSKVYFGSTGVAGRGPATDNGGTLWAEAIVWRTGAATQFAAGRTANGATATQLVTNASPTETLSSAIIIKATGASDVAGAANDVTFKGAVVECQ